MSIHRISITIIIVGIVSLLCSFSSITPYRSQAATRDKPAKNDIPVAYAQQTNTSYQIQVNRYNMARSSVRSLRSLRSLRFITLYPNVVSFLQSPHNTTYAHNQSQHARAHHTALHHTTALSSPLSHAFRQPSTPFGIETNTGTIPNPLLLNYARELGVAWIRLNTVSWRSVQPEPERIYNWEALETFEQEVLAANAANLTPIVVVDDQPDWATAPYLDPYTNSFRHARCGAIEEEHLDEFAAFMQALVARYSVPPYNVRYWELGNEVDIDPRLINEYLQGFFGCWGTIDDPYYGGRHYGAMLNVVTPAIKARDPDARIIIGGLALDTPDTTEPGKGKPERFFEGILKAGAGQNFDIVGFHVYPWYRAPATEAITSDIRIENMHPIYHPSHDLLLASQDNRAAIDPDRYDERWEAWGGVTLGKARYLRDIMARYGIDKPLFLNETALVSYLPHTTAFYEAQADHLVRQLARVLSTHIQSYIWYTLHESGWLSAGLLNGAMRPQPAYQAYHFFVQTIGQTSMQPDHITTYGTNVEAYRLYGTTSYIDVLWTTDGVTTNITIAPDFFQATYTRSGTRQTPRTHPSSIHITVGTSPIYIVYRYPPPVVTSVSPTDYSNSHINTMHITGSNILSYTLVQLGPYTVSDTHRIDSQHLNVTLPAGLVPGLYPLVLKNPDGAGSALLPGITISDEHVEIADVRPPYGRIDMAGGFNIYGSGFTSVISVSLGTLPLTPTHINARHMQVQLPPYALATGSYTLRMHTSDGHHATMPDSYRVYTTTQEDVTAHAFELWTDPSPPRQNEQTQVGILVHRPVGTQDLRNVSIHLYEEPENAERTHIGSDMLPDVPPHRVTATHGITWTPATTGTVTLTAFIDTTQTISETIETNNTISRTVVVEPTVQTAHSDTSFDGPRLRSFHINNGSTTTRDQTVPLQVEVTDATQRLDGLHILFVEYAYYEGASAWVPVQQSGWLDYMEPGSYTWHLMPMPGVRYMQVWAADRTGTISRLPQHTFINYVPLLDTVGMSAKRVYRYQLAQGDHMHIQVEPVQGNPDMYMWYDTAHKPLATSANASGIEFIDIVAPETGVYQVEVRDTLHQAPDVYSYGEAVYHLTVDIAQTSTATPQPGNVYDPGDQFSPVLVQPLIPLFSEPAAQLALPSAPHSSFHYLYLPLVQQSFVQVPVVVLK